MYARAAPGDGVPRRADPDGGAGGGNVASARGPPNTPENSRVPPFESAAGPKLARKRQGIAANTDGFLGI